MFGLYQCDSTNLATIVVERNTSSKHHSVAALATKKMKEKFNFRLWAIVLKGQLYIPCAKLVVLFVVSFVASSVVVNQVVHSSC